MTEILIIGGTGFISSALVKKLLKKKCRITLLNRGRSKNLFSDDPLVTTIHGNRKDRSVLSSTASKVKYDVVYDMVAYRPEDSLLAAEVFKNKIGRFIHCSTISVYMISNDVTIPITEDQDKHPVMDYFARNPFGMDYGIDKRKCEEVLWHHHNEKSFPVSMLRPTFVSGPNDPAVRDYFWIERILDGQRLLVPGLGDFSFQQVYIEDAAEAFSKIIETDKSIGEAYNVADEKVHTLNTYLERLAHLLNKEIDICHIDQNKFDSLSISSSNRGDVFPFNTRRDAVFSLKKIKKDIGYTSTSFDNWMKKTIDWYLNEYNGHSIGYENRAEEIKIINRL